MQSIISKWKKRSFVSILLLLQYITLYYVVIIKKGAMGLLFERVGGK
jgi:hypothetical protein